MPDFTLTEKQFNDLKHILTVDNANLADHPEFFDELGLDHKEFIAERIALCNAFKIDFWNTVDAFSPSYNLQRLKALYNGQSIKEFEEQHKRPTPSGVAK
ncbi:MAG TPA: hypothetical protein VIJ92_14760 [Ginsengibacter sp.]